MKIFVCFACVRRTSLFVIRRWWYKKSYSSEKFYRFLWLYRTYTIITLYHINYSFSCNYMYTFCKIWASRKCFFFPFSPCVCFGGKIITFLHVTWIRLRIYSGKFVLKNNRKYFLCLHLAIRCRCHNHDNIKYNNKRRRKMSKILVFITEFCNNSSLSVFG